MAGIVKKMGRPTANPKTEQLTLRLTSDEADLLKYCADKLNLTRTQVIIKGAEMVRNSIEQEA